jgi:hypothetical protein
VVENEAAARACIPRGGDGEEPRAPLADVFGDVLRQGACDLSIHCSKLEPLIEHRAVCTARRLA